jgi:hypothetical protein
MTNLDKVLKYIATGVLVTQKVAPLLPGSTKRKAAIQKAIDLAKLGTGSVLTRKEAASIGGVVDAVVATYKGVGVFRKDKAPK